uniref:Uncharacterized protein n=1 Tax=Meloidogyne enterolobii TaxID=390850 RepID=A0A6V7XF17_MELEN|nr:unnamed protein product [Meloidogyne enterolobii]
MFVPAASRSAAFFNAKRRRSSNNCGPNSSKPKRGTAILISSALSNGGTLTSTTTSMVGGGSKNAIAYLKGKKQQKSKWRGAGGNNEGVKSSPSIAGVSSVNTLLLNKRHPIKQKRRLSQHRLSFGMNGLNEDNVRELQGNQTPIDFPSIVLQLTSAGKKENRCDSIVTNTSIISHSQLPFGRSLASTITTTAEPFEAVASWGARRRAVDISAHKACALLMARMKEREGCPTPM